LRLVYDKNGCGNPDIYCWKCSGKEDDDVKVMQDGRKRIVKGQMIPIDKKANVHYECIDCGYNTYYRSDYIKAWKI